MVKLFRYGVLKIIAIIMMTVLFFFMVPDLERDGYGVLDEKKIVTKFTVLSDCHLAGNELNTFKNFATIIQDVKNCDYKNDVTVFLGDDTNTGQHIESLFFYGTLGKIDLDTPFVNVPGNHDTGNDSGVYEDRFERFQYYNKYYLGLDVPAPYYYKIINNTYFIVLSSEDNNCHDPIMTSAQVEWFSETMEAASKTGNPIFVCSHHHYTAYDATKSQLYTILSSYKNVFYMYGHTHMDLGSRTIRHEGKNDGFTVINVPKSNESGETDDTSFIGFQVEVYPTEVVFRPRNFRDGIWNTDYVKRIALD